MRTVSKEFVAERLEMVARYSPEIGWVKDAVKGGCFRGFVVLSNGDVVAYFKGTDWSDTVKLDSEYIEMSLVDIERKFSKLASDKVKEEKARRNKKKQEDLAYYKRMYKRLQRDEELNRVGG